MNAMQKKRPAPADVVEVTRHLALMARLKQGPAETLTQSSQLLPWLSPIAALIARGDAASAAMRRHPELFPPFAADMCAAAEASPRPAEILTALARFLERSERLRDRLAQALLYPLILFHLLLIGLVGFSELVLPAVLLPMARAHDASSHLTRDLTSLIGFLTTFHVLALLALLMGIALDTAAVGARDFVKPLARRLPFAAPLRNLGDQALWSRALGALLRAGVELPVALEKACQVVPHGRLHRQLEPVANLVRRGSTLANALDRTPDLEPVLGWAAAAGAALEDMAGAFTAAADTLESTVERRCELTVRTAGPLAMACVGLFVTAGLLAFWVPFYQLTTSMW